MFRFDEWFTEAYNLVQYNEMIIADEWHKNGRQDVPVAHPYYNDRRKGERPPPPKKKYCREKLHLFSISKIMASVEGLENSLMIVCSQP